MERVLIVVDPWQGARLIDGILADLRAANEGTSQDLWLSRQQRRARVRKLDALWEAVVDLCDWC